MRWLEAATRAEAAARLDARAINAKGQIVGLGTRDAIPRDFVLTAK